jgi:hypothetical protein
VYKDIYEITENKPALDKLENEFCNHDDYNSENKTSGASESIAEFTVDSLVFLCNKYGYSAFSTLILLLKNAFEGHAYLFFNIRPDQLFEEGIYKVKDKEELLVSSFF